MGGRVLPWAFLLLRFLLLLFSVIYVLTRETRRKARFVSPTDRVPSEADAGSGLSPVRRPVRPSARPMRPPRAVWQLATPLSGRPPLVLLLLLTGRPVFVVEVEGGGNRSGYLKKRRLIPLDS